MSLVEITENEVDLNDDSYFGDNDIINIVYKNDVDQFMDFLKESGPDTDLNVLAKQGLSLAHIAARNNSIRLLRELAERGVDLHHIDDNCETVLHAAARMATKEVMLFLIEKKLELNFQNKNGDSPLHCAVREGNLTGIDILCLRNCKLNLRNKNGETPLCLAVINGKLDSAKVLISFKADMSAEDKNGYTPLHHSICRHQSTLALMLINSGAHVNQPDLDRNTPLHLAAKEGLMPVVQTLCAFGCKVDCYNNEGLTALQVGARAGIIDVVRCLLLAGASPFIPSKDNVYPDIMAYARGHKKTGALLHTMTPERRAICIEQLVPTSRPITKIKLKVFGSSMSGKTALIDALRSGYFRGYFSTKLRSFDLFSAQEADNLNLKERVVANEIRYELDHEEFTKGIDVQSINVSGCGDFSVWEFSGYEPYYSMYDHFIGDTGCIHLITISLMDNMEVVKERLRFWLEYIGSRIPSREPLEHCGKAHFMSKVIIVATHAEVVGGERNEHGLLENPQITNLFEKIKSDFQFNLEVYEELIFVDSSDKISAEMKHLKSVLSNLRCTVINKLPTTNGLVDTVVLKLPDIIPKQEFPVLSWQDFVQKVRSKVNPLCNEDHLKDLIQQLQYMGEVIYLETESEPDMIVMSPNWLCSDVLGYMLSFENISNSRVTGSFTADEVQLMLGVENTKDFLRILTSLNCCSECPVEDEVQYEFPSLNFVECRNASWLEECERYRYIGVQLHASPSQLLHLFPRIQVQYRASIYEECGESPRAELDQWFHGSLLMCAQHDVQCLLTLESGNQVIEVKARAACGGGGGGGSGAVGEEGGGSSGDEAGLLVLFGYFQDTLNIVTQTLEEMCPNLDYELFCMGGLDGDSCRTRHFALFSQGEVMRHMLACDGRVNGLDLPLRLLLFLDDPGVLGQVKLGPDLHVSSLRLPTVRKLCQMLDPADDMGRDWCLLAVKLGLNGDVPALDRTNESTKSRTGSLISSWGTRDVQAATVKHLIRVLEAMDRLDAALLLTASCPLYQFIPVAPDHDFETL